MQTIKTMADSPDVEVPDYEPRHITNTNSGYPIGIEQPQLVVKAIRDVFDAARSSKPK